MARDALTACGAQDSPHDKALPWPIEVENLCSGFSSRMIDCEESIGNNTREDCGGEFAADDRDLNTKLRSMNFIL